MISTMPGSSVPTFVLIPASMDRPNTGKHVEVESVGRNETPEVKSDLSNPGSLIIQTDSDQVLASADEDSILYRSMAIAENQAHF